MKPYVKTVKVQLELTGAWVKENPQLAVKTVAEFVVEQTRDRKRVEVKEAMAGRIVIVAYDTKETHGGVEV